jgi:hypothetical protein
VRANPDSENNNGAQRDGRAEERRAVHIADLSSFATPGVTALCAKLPAGIDVKPTLRFAAADATATGIADTYAAAIAFHSAAMALRTTTRSAYP